MKTLDQVIKRNDYSRLTASLKERVEELAGVIRNKMVELDLTSLGDYSLTTVITNSGYSDTFLSDEGYSLESIGKDFYYCGDFNARVVGASNSMALSFLNEVKELIERLDAIETEKSAKIEEALNATAELV